MKLLKGRVTNYRSVKDSGWFEIEGGKTIFVGSNEAGKTAILQALQQINPPVDVPKLDSLRDYPRGDYNDITTKKVDPAATDVAVVHFTLEDNDKKLIPEEFHKCIYIYGRKLDNKAWHDLEGGPSLTTYQSIKKDLVRLASHMDNQFSKNEEVSSAANKPSEELASVTLNWSDYYQIRDERVAALEAWLNKNIIHVDEENETENKRFDELQKACGISKSRAEVLTILASRKPIFVLFSNYFRVRPLIHLEHLATRIEQKLLDDAQYDYGNECLLKLLGFSARELSKLGKVAEPDASDLDGLKTYRDKLDKRQYQLNSASVRLTSEIRRIWNPNPNRAEADKLRILADGQYLKVVVEDDLGVEIELDQRSEGFQWLVSFFVVFFAEAIGKHENAILLLDEPGLSLHGLKQRDFRETISRLSETNQTIYTTHSPFLVGPDELDLVRVVEMTDRKVGTKVHTTVTADDPASLLPLQEALGYDLAQSLFAQQRNLVVEGLTDLWYLEATAELLRASDIVDLNSKIALISANSASKVVYYATILHAHNLKIAALLDSDAAGEQAATQENLVNTLGNKSILRSKDFYKGEVKTPEIEDLLRDTLVSLAKEAFGWDVLTIAQTQKARPIIEILNKEIKDFSKYKLAKAYVRWTREHLSDDLTVDELSQWKLLIDKVNSVLK